MSREDREDTEEQLKTAELYLAQAEGDSALAKERKSRVEIIKQQKKAFERAEQIRREVPVSSETSFAPPRRANPFSLERPISDLEQIKEVFEADLGMAEYHQGVAAFKVKGRITPTAKVEEFKRRIGEAGRKITDLTEDLQQTDNFLSRHSRYYLTGGQEEKE